MQYIDMLKQIINDKDMESSYLEYLDANNFYGWAMSQKLPANGFEWVEELSQFSETSKQITMKIVIKDIFLKKMLNIEKNCLIFIVIFLFYLKERKSENVISLIVTYMAKRTMSFT